MKFNEFIEYTSLVDSDLLLVQEASTLAIKKVKLSTLKAYIGVSTPPPTAPYTNEALAVINAIQATGVTLTTVQKDACNKRIADMIAANTWVKRIVYYGFLGGNSSCHAINWKNPGTNNILWNGNVTHNNLGIQSDGSTGFGNTQLTENSLNQASSHVSAYARTAQSGSANRDVGNMSANSFQFIISFSGQSYYRSFNTQTNLEVGTPPALTGYFMGVRDNANAALYRNGTAYKTSTTSVNSISELGNIVICRAFNDHTTKQFASIGIGTALTHSQASDDYISEQIYQSSLSRQV